MFRQQPAAGYDFFSKKKIIDTLYGCGLAVLLYRFGKFF